MSALIDGGGMGAWFRSGRWRPWAIALGGVLLAWAAILVVWN